MGGEGDREGEWRCGEGGERETGGWVEKVYM